MRAISPLPLGEVGLSGPGEGEVGVVYVKRVTSKSVQLGNGCENIFLDLRCPRLYRWLQFAASAAASFAIVPSYLVTNSTSASLAVEISKYRPGRCVRRRREMCEVSSGNRRVVSRSPDGPIDARDCRQWPRPAGTGCHALRS